MLAVAAVLAVVLGVGWWWRSAPQPVAPGATFSGAAEAGAEPTIGASSPASSLEGSARAPAAPGATGSTSAEVTVHVVGLVRKPGIVRLPAGSRLAAAVDAAGGAGPAADLSSVNLARVALDGEQISVLGRGPRAGRWTAPPQSSGTSPSLPGTTATEGPLDLNSASAEALQELPGVGPVLASRIVEWRTRHGRFSSVEELREVEGIGDRKFATLSDAVQVR